VQVAGSADAEPAVDQRRSISSLSSDGVTQPSPRVTPKTSVVGPMRRSDHGAIPTAEALRGLASSSVALTTAADATGGVPKDLTVITFPFLVVLLGGATLVLRGTPRLTELPPNIG
jgi:hypothetical protein